MAKIKSVDQYIQGLSHWQDEVAELRSILQALPLEETIKWGAPTYVAFGKNVLGIAAFKDYFGLWFFQGALLTDPGRCLMNAQEGKTKAMRQWRFTAQDQIDEEAIRQYAGEAIALAEQGKEIKPARSQMLSIPAELQDALDQDKAAKASFSALTQGRQREFAQYVEEAKRAETKTRRLEKILPMILAGQGLNDRYRR